MVGSPAHLTGPTPRASFGQRAGALLIDVLIVLVVDLLIFFVFGAIAAGLGSASSTILNALGGLIGLIGVLLYIFFPIAYYSYLEGQPSGQTFGKRALNIRVVDFNTAGPITLGHAFLRNLARILSGFLFGLGYLWMLWDPQQQTWHDKLVGTTVVPTSAYPA